MIVSALVVVLSILVVMALRLQGGRISKINVYGAEVISPELIVSTASEVISGYYLWVIPRNNFILYPENKLLSEIRTRFPRFSSVDISLTSLTDLDIAVSEREPFALYCGDVSKPNESSSCYFLDRTGLIFDRAPSFSSGVYFVFASTSPALEPLGQVLLPSSEFESLMNFVDRLATLGIKGDTLVMSPDDFTMTTTNDGEVIWRRSTPYDIVFSNLESFLTEPSIASQRDFVQRVRTLDLRTEDKVFYRFNAEQ